ncbi:hypothetical protein [Actinomadura citrea]|uniref:Uncharacterized protein n=1 Tax=Actinomadura citrea TaxID=46158 RepID=A0A7Y9KCS3_9ACTN|nr:hypothetical protein [Actinomadura citrea]NYE10854.1 hypothetical protein [Actinomadura citrea]
MRARITTPSSPFQDRVALHGRAGRPGWDRHVPKPRTVPRPRPPRKPGSVR